MKERPILFNGAMVRAVLSGQKTQTRRLMSPQPERYPWGTAWKHKTGLICCDSGDRPGPYAPWHVGDLLWVRETFDAPEGSTNQQECAYRADYDRDPDGARWRPSIHMPRWASRITLEVTDVRVEQLQDISESDAAAEGCDHDTGTNPPWPTSAREWFKSLWDSIEEGRPWRRWDDNPWVWVVSFKRTEAKAEAA